MKNWTCLLIAVVNTSGAESLSIRVAPAPTIDLSTNITTQLIEYGDEYAVISNNFIQVTSAGWLQTNGVSAFQTMDLPIGETVRLYALSSDGRGYLYSVTTPSTSTNFAGYWLTNSLAHHILTNHVAQTNIASPTSQAFSTRNVGSLVFVRDTNNFLLKSYQPQLTSFSVAGAYVTALTKRHAISASHLGDLVGVNIVWSTMYGTNVTRTVTASTQILTTDARICLLDSDLPDEVYLMTVAPSNYTSYLPTVRNYSLGNSTVPAWKFDQNEHVAPISLAQDNAQYGVGFATNVGKIWISTNWWKPVVSGDSSKPIFALVGTNVMLVSQFHTALTGPSYGYLNANIQSAMDSLSVGAGLTPSSYVLKTNSLTAWPSY